MPVFHVDYCTECVKLMIMLTRPSKYMPSSFSPNRKFKLTSQKNIRFRLKHYKCINITIHRCKANCCLIFQPFSSTRSNCSCCILLPVLPWSLPVLWFLGILYIPISTTVSSSSYLLFIKLKKVFRTQNLTVYFANDDVEFLFRNARNGK